MVARHGTRTYGDDDVTTTKMVAQKIAQAMKQGGVAPNLLSNQIQAMINWESKLPDDKRLMELGRTEHAFHARNYFKLIGKSGLMQQIRQEPPLFESSEKSRAVESAQAFRVQWDQLTGQNIPEPIVANVSKLYFHKNCPLFQKLVLDNETAEFQYMRSNESVIAEAIVIKVNQRKLGLPQPVLDFFDLMALQKTAAYENAIFGSSVFQPLFDLSDEEFMEFADDLSNYWTGAYANNLNSEMSCTLLNDIFDVDTPGNNPVSFKFGHLETLMPVYGALDLFHDAETNMVWSAQQEFYENRNFDTSEMGNMASNIAFMFVSLIDLHLCILKYFVFFYKSVSMPKFFSSLRSRFADYGQWAFTKVTQSMSLQVCMPLVRC